VQSTTDTTPDVARAWSKRDRDPAPHVVSSPAAADPVAAAT
jgi:hypothetical protein